jgi:DNA processing protein
MGNSISRLALAIQALPGIGPSTTRKVVQKIKYEKPDGINDDPIVLLGFVRDYGGIKARNENINLNAITEALERADTVLREAEIYGVTVVSMCDDRYPRRLAEVSDAPPILFIKGVTEIMNENAVAVIGTRRPTPEALEKCRWLTERVVQRGVVVVSGLALGCDAAAHSACLEFGGKTIAVLSGGLDKVQPMSNAKLAEDIASAGGALISEQPIGYQPRPRDFVIRDRIQSGMSTAVIVVQTGEKGGTMHTVRYAQKHKRPIACLMPDNRPFWENGAGAGNDLLVKENIAASIVDRSSLDVFMDSIARHDAGLNIKGGQRELF